MTRLHSIYGRFQVDQGKTRCALGLKTGARGKPEPLSGTRTEAQKPIGAKSAGNVKAGSGKDRIAGPLGTSRGALLCVGEM